MIKISSESGKKFTFLDELADFDHNSAILLCILPINMQPIGNKNILVYFGITVRTDHGSKHFRIVLQTKEFCLKFFRKVIFRVAELQTLLLCTLCLFAISTRPIDTKPDLSYKITQEVLFEILPIEARRKNFKQNLWQKLYQLKKSRF